MLPRVRVLMRYRVNDPPQRSQLPDEGRGERRGLLDLSGCRLHIVATADRSSLSDAETPGESAMPPSRLSNATGR